MAKRLMTEQEVLDVFKIEDFRHLKKDDVIKFVSMIPQMDKEVASKCIEQFPNFKEFGTGIFDILNKSYEKIINSGRDSEKEAIAAYQFILDQMQEMLNKDALTFDEKRTIAYDMVFVADKIAELDKHWKEFLGKLAYTLGIASTIVLAIGAAVLGVKIDSDRLIR